MLNFSSFLTEAMKSSAETTAKRTHLEHPEDLTFDSHEGVAQAENHLREFHKSLLGKKSDVTTSTKIDGAPAIHVGMDENGQHFVATKGVFNKNPKLYRTEDDIDRDYDQDHPLNHILKQSLRHLPQTMPRDMKAGEMYKGDIVSVAGGDRPPKKEKGFVTTQPNVVKYKYPKDSQEGRELADSQVGVVWHTKFNKKGEADSISPKDRAKFARSKDVFTLNPDVKANPSNYSAPEQAAFENHMENARREYGKIKPEIYDNLAGHNQTLRTYINQTVRTGEQPSHEGYMQHLTDRQQKDVDSVKTPVAKDRKIQQHASFIQQATGNKKDIESLLKLHSHLQNAKNVLVGVADKNSPSTNELPNGEATGHEGYVTTDKSGVAVKHVDRANFSRQLLTGQGNIGKPKPAPQPMAEEVEPETTTASGPSVPHTLWTGRMQGVHGGHILGVQAAMDDAAQHGGGHTILLTHTHDKNNPLTPEQKLYYAQRGLPRGANIQMTSPESPSLLHQASKLNKSGVTDLRIMAGSDRAASYQSLFDKYNGVPGPHGGFKFNSVKVIPIGSERTEGDGDSVSAFSGSAVRRSAAADDKGSFDKMVSPYLSAEDKDNMRKDLKAGMDKFAKKPKAIKEGYEDDDEERREFMMRPENQKPTAISKAIMNYTPLGDVAKIGSAISQGKIKDAILPAAQLATNLIPGRALATAASAGVGVARGLKETTTVAVGGLGFNSGNPAPNDNHIANYVEASTADADTRDNILKGMINKSSSPETHEKIGFKAFDPSKDLKLAKGGK